MPPYNGTGAWGIRPGLRCFRANGFGHEISLAPKMGDWSPASRGVAQFGSALRSGRFVQPLAHNFQTPFPQGFTATKPGSLKSGWMSRMDEYTHPSISKGEVEQWSG